jgi:hypothetical protein
MDLKNFNFIGKDLLVNEPMDRSCKVAVLIPVYDENFNMILRPIYSLAGQRGVGFDEFEAVVIVNNSRAEAKNKNKAFVANQQAIKLIRYAQKLISKPPENLSGENLKQIKKIWQSGLRVRLINKSTLKNAEAENNVGLARRLAAGGIVRRFHKNGQKERGIILITDADCAFSPNTIYELIGTFKKYRINGMAGNLSPITDPEFPEPRLLKKVLEVSGELMPWPKSLLRPGKNLYFEKGDSLGFAVLKTGQNMAVSAGAYLLAGGFDDLDSSEDVLLGQKISNLPGDIVKNLNYTVTTIVRPSVRTGAGALGRRIKFILDSVENYRLGKSKKIFMLDRKKISEFYFYLSSLGKSRMLNVQWLKKLLLLYGFNTDGLPQKELRRMAEIFTFEYSGDIKQHKFLRTDRMLVEHFYHRFPKKDVTGEFANFLV